MAKKEKEKLVKIPKSNVIAIELNINEAKELLKVKDLPAKMKRILQENIAYNKFWNFSRNCRYLVAEEVRLGLLNPTAWIKKCTHKDNKSKFKKCKYDVCPLKKK